MGVCTVSLVRSRSYYTADGRRIIEGIFDVTFSNSYATGGDDLDLSPYFKSVDIIEVETPIAGSYLIEVDRANNKLKAYTGVGTEVTAGTDLSGVTVRIRVIGPG
jgi:hypothetical protein